MGTVKNREIMPWHNVQVVKMWHAYLGGLCLLQHVHEQTESLRAFSKLADLSVRQKSELVSLMSCSKVGETTLSSSVEM